MPMAVKLWLHGPSDHTRTILNFLAWDEFPRTHCHGGALPCSTSAVAASSSSSSFSSSATRRMKNLLLWGESGKVWKRRSGEGAFSGGGRCFPAAFGRRKETEEAPVFAYS